ncbi:MAG: CoA transferase, partial [Sphingomonadaceae bacterium]|nr:CoA transferase [Sphingomonadaceae bacterium]
RPGVTERLGLGPEACLARNPRLVYGRMTGWGQTGPLALRAGHDLNYIALTGALHAIGRRGEPPTVPLNLIGDYGGGAMFLALGVVSAVLSARVTGEGQIVDAAMTEGAAVLMSMIYAFHGAGAWSEERESNLLDGAAPFYRCYECADGGHVAVAAIEPQFFAELLAGLNLAPDRFVQHDRARWPEMARAFEAAFLARTRDQWAELFEPTDACVAPVLSMTEAPNHPHNAARRAFATLDGIVQPMPAPRFSGGLAEPEPAEAISAEEALARWTDAG